MSGIGLYLNEGKDYEIIHQLVLYMLLKDSDFVKILLDLDIKNPFSFWEYKKGLFDLGVGTDKDTPIALIELKVNSGLTTKQLKKQTEFLTKNKIKGYHILLGTTDYEFVRNDKRDDISIESNGSSEKIGFSELISGLEAFLKSKSLPEDFHDLTNNYLTALLSQKDYLYDAAFKKEGVYKGHYYYSLYKRLQEKLFIKGLNFKIYSIANKGSTSFVINDAGTWFNISFKGEEFKLFQEIFNGELFVRGNSEKVDKSVSREFAECIISELESSLIDKYGFNVDYRRTKYMIIARKPLDFKDPDDLSFETNLLVETHKELERIFKKLTKKKCYRSNKHMK